MGFGTLINDIVYKISGRVLSSSGLYTPSDYQYDYALGGIPFLSAASDTRPDLEGPIEQRKQQFDAFKDPGEYSLNQWWLRSQTSFTGGAGVIYQDPDTQGQSLNIRYKHSIGVDPFSDPDNLQLLRESAATGTTDAGTNDGFAYVDGILDTATERVWVAQGRHVYITTPTASSLTTTSTTSIATTNTASSWTGGIVTTQTRSSPGSTPFQHMHSYMDDPDDVNIGGLYVTNATGGAISSIRRLFIAASTSTGTVTLGFARDQLLLGQNNKLYTLAFAGPSNQPLPAAAAQISQDQIITCIVDGPDAIYVSANDDSRGFIYKTTFDSAGVVNGLTQVAILPTGETINSIAAYVATYLVITTGKGIRVATFTGSGLSYGPPTLTVPSSSVFPGPDTGGGFGRIAFFGTRAYVTTLGPAQHDGDYGLMAVDLGISLTDNTAGAVFNPYSTWTYVPGTASSIIGVTVTPTGRTVFTSGSGIGTGTSVYIEAESTLISTGYLDTGRCRFNTVEPKLFKYISIRTPPDLQGDLTVSIIDQNDGVTSYQTFGPTVSPGTNDISTPIPAGPQNWISLRFTLRRGAVDLTIGAKLDSWQIKALPGTLKQRKIVRQFLCFNQEKDKAGQLISGDTLSLDRLTAVRQMCQRGDTVTLQDLVNNISDQVVIDDYQFTMLAPPGPNGENYGGYLTLNLRTVADNVPPLSFAGVDVEN